MRTPEDLYQILKDKYLVLDTHKHIDVYYMRDKYKIVSGYGTGAIVDRKKYKNLGNIFLFWEPNLTKYGRRPTYQEFIKMFKLESRARASAETTEAIYG